MSIATSRAIEYPSSDGQPMAETWIHVRAIMWLHQALEDFFGNRPDVFIASDIFWYWEKGNKEACISPDVMVVTGVQPRDPHERRSFFSWEEGGAIPAAVFEMASENTWKKDVTEKYEKYAELGVPEYFIFDPEGRYLKNPRLRGFRLRGKTYRPISSRELASNLGFQLRAEDTMLRLVDAKSGEPIPTRAEAVEAARAEAGAAQQAADTARQAVATAQQAADTAQRAVEAAQQVAVSAQATANAEKQRADAEKQRAEAEKQRADRLAVELEQLKQQLRGSQP